MRIEDELKQVIIEGLKLEDVEMDSLDDDAPLFVEGLGLDSLDAVELVVLLQKHFNVEIKEMDETRDAFESIKTLSNYIRARQAEA